MAGTHRSPLDLRRRFAAAGRVSRAVRAQALNLGRTGRYLQRFPTPRNAGFGKECQNALFLEIKNGFYNRRKKINDEHWDEKSHRTFGAIGFGGCGAARTAAGFSSKRREREYGNGKQRAGSLKRRFRVQRG